MNKIKDPAAVERFAMDVLPYAENWTPGTPVCTGAAFAGLLKALGKNVINPALADLLYFLAATPTDKAEREERREILYNARIRAEGAETSLELTSAIMADHNTQSAAPPGTLKQAAVDALRRLCPAEPVQVTNLAALSLSNVQTAAVEWLVPGLLPRGELSVLGADGGTGKGLWQAQLIAHVTTGNSNSFFQNPLQNPCNVLIFSGEDDPARVLRPRLLAAGADMSKAFVVTSDGFFRDNRHLLTMDSEEFSAIIRNTAPDMVVIDPYQSFLNMDIKMAERNQMRGTTTPFRAVLRETNAAGLLVAHSNKKGAVAGRQRLADSSDLWDASRCVIMMGRDKLTKQVYVSNEKNSYAAECKTTLFTIEGATVEGVKTAVAVYQGTTDKKDYDFIMAKAARPEGSKADAKEAICSILNESQSGSMESEKLRLAVMEEAGCSEATFRRARTDLKDKGTIYTKQIPQKNGVNKWYVFYRGETAEHLPSESL